MGNDPLIFKTESIHFVSTKGALDYSFLCEGQ